MPNTFFPFTHNIRTLENGQVGPRPPVGSALFTPHAASQILSLRRMQNRLTPSNPAYISHTDEGKVYAGNTSALTGFPTTERISMVPYRPNQSVESWMYLNSSARSGKVKGDGTGRNMGIAEPLFPCTAEVSDSNQSALLSDFESQSPWNLIGTATLAGPTNRYNATITKVLMDVSGSPVPGDSSCVLSGTTDFAKNTVGYVNGSLTDPCFIEDSFTAPANSTIAAIIYDTGSNGLCWIELTGSPITVTRNQVYRINSGGGTDEYVRVLQVFGTAAGEQTWIRVATAFTHSTTETLTGTASWRIFFPSGASDGNTIRDRYLTLGIVANKDGMFTTFDSGGTIQGRVIQPTDNVHLLVKASSVAFTNLIITFDVDPNNPDFVTNALQWTIPAGSFSAGNWVDISVAISALVRIGTNTDLDFNSGITGIQIVCTTAGALNFQISDLDIVGQYGPATATGDPGVFYCCKYRDTLTGAVSNPSPPMRVSVFPASTGQGVVVVPPGSTESAAIGAIADIYRFGNGLLNYTYIGSGTPEYPFLDVFDDASVSNNPLMAFDDFQPFPSIDTPHSGTVSVQGFTVTWKSGDAFVTTWGPGTEITINGIVYTLYRRPSSTLSLEILQDGGTQNNVSYSIPRPVLLGAPMPAMWGPTDNAGYLFACGDPLRPGTLYFTKGNQPDSAPDTNQIEVTSPSEPLMNGVIVNGLGMVFSTERAWWIYPNFGNVVATVTGLQGSPFYLIESISNRGLFARFAICTDGGGTVFFLAKDGIYMSKGGAGSVCITDAIYSMFPHETGTQQGVTIAGVVVPPPSMTTYLAYLKLTFSEDRLYFDYRNSTGDPYTLVMDTRTGVWGTDVTNPVATVHAIKEGNAEGTAVGCIDGTIREFDGTGAETVVGILQSVMTESEAGGWQHAKEFNINYLDPSSLQFQIVASAGGLSPVSATTLPVNANQIKLLQNVGPNKFKLAQYIIQGSNAWRVWIQDFQLKQGAWGRGKGYATVNPFEAFGKVARI